jgi:aminopeptidase N
MKLVVDQYWSAENLTDRIAALSYLCNSNSPERTKALDHFYNEWKDDSVVLNKWFTVQAQSLRPDAFEEVKALTKHPAFNINNPNNVYSLLRAFGANLVRFHDPKKDTFKFFADCIIEIDAKNPQVASRLCASFNFVQKLDPAMKERALTEIKRIVAVETLSKNSRELLQSAL